MMIITVVNQSRCTIWYPVFKFIKRKKFNEKIHQIFKCNQGENKMKRNWTEYMYCWLWTMIWHTRLNALGHYTYMKFFWSLLYFALLSKWRKKKEFRTPHTFNSIKSANVNFNWFSCFSLSIFTIVCSDKNTRRECVVCECEMSRLSVCMWFYLFCDVTRIDINVSECAWKRWEVI